MAVTCMHHLHEQNGGRKIQTVGTPWQGTPLMGSLVDLGKIFGFGCGYNADLTTDGASRWLSKIPVDTQKEVYYYTTESVSHTMTSYIPA